MFKGFKKLHNLGIDEKTPTFLIDRVLYSNFVYLVVPVVVLSCVPVNLVSRYYYLIGFDFYVIATCLVSLFLNFCRKYLLSRITFITSIFLGLSFMAMIQGNIVAIEHFFIPASILALNCFHPNEGKYGIIFVSVGVGLFWFFESLTHPIWNIDPAITRYTLSNLTVNEAATAILILMTLLGMTNAYSKAIGLLESQRSKAERSSRLASLGVLAGGIAHEINNPMTVIIGYLSLLEPHLPKEGSEKVAADLKVQRIRSGCERVTKIVSSLRSFSEPSEWADYKSVGLNELFEDLLCLCQQRFESKGAQIKIADFPRPDLRIFAKKSQIQEVLLSLLNNSLDAINECNEKNIAIAVEIEDRTVNILISDNGSGVASENKQRIFEPFFTTKEVGQGTGLGLFVAQRLMVENGGNLVLLHEKNPTTFQLSLNLSERESVSS